MPERSISGDRLAAYAAHLRAEERSPGTIEKYLRDVGALAAWLGGRAVTKEEVTAWRDALLARGLTPSTVNSMLAAVNGFFRFTGRELTRDEYERLLAAAGNSGQRRLELLLETICATGIRVSEVRYLTVEAGGPRPGGDQPEGQDPHHPAAREAVPEAAQIRPETTRSPPARCSSPEAARGLSRKQIWAEMKSLCGKAGVEPSKVFPHNLRHLFARTFYRVVPGRGKAGGRAGPQLSGDHPALSDLHRPGARPDPGAPAPADIGQNQYFV